MVSTASKSHKSQIEEVVPGMFILSSLSLVGSKEWIIRQRKDVESEQSPGLTARDHVRSQSTSGCFVSILQALYSLMPLALTSWVMKFSSKTLYQVAVDIVVMFNKPSSLTCLILAKKVSG